MENSIIFGTPLYLALLALCAFLMLWGAKGRGRICSIISYLGVIGVCIAAALEGAGYDELITVFLSFALIGILNYDGEREGKK